MVLSRNRLLREIQLLQAEVGTSGVRTVEWARDHATKAILEHDDALRAHTKRLHVALVAVLSAEAWEDPGTKAKHTVEEWIAGDPVLELARAALAAYNKEPR